jgi:hypothetical protein
MKLNIGTERKGSQRKPRKLGNRYYLHPYQQLTYNSVIFKWLARGMPPASRPHTRHSIGNGWGTSPRHAPSFQLVTIYRTNILYRLLMHYETYLGERVQVLYVNQSYNHCNIYWDNLLFIQYSIHSVAIKKLDVFITPFYKTFIFVKIICMRTHFIHNKPKTHNWQYVDMKILRLQIKRYSSYLYKEIFEFCNIIIFQSICFGGNGWKGGDLNYGN